MRVTNFNVATAQCLYAVLCWPFLALGVVYALDQLLPRTESLRATLVLSFLLTAVPLAAIVAWRTIWWIELDEQGLTVRHAARLRSYPRQAVSSVSFTNIGSSVQVHPLPITIPLGSHLFFVVNLSDHSTVRVKVGSGELAGIRAWAEARGLELAAPR